MSRIVISSLVKSYPSAQRRATDDVSLEVADGEFVVLVGPSGCGKTTLLRMVAGLERPDGGSIHIGDRDVTSLSPQRRDVSMVFQSYAIFPHMRVRQNIAFGLAMRKTPAAEVNRRVAEAAELLQLNDLLDRFPSQLSGGQRQRVAVARAIVVDAGVLLMDEPLSNLDALLRLQFRAELKKIVRQIGATTLYVTHDQAEAMSLGDRVAVMRDGRIVQAGDPLTVYNYPAHRFVGDFLGAPPMNFFLAEPGAVGAPDSLKLGKVLVGVRAENIALGTEGIPGTVEVVEPTGASTLLTVATSFGTLKVQAPPAVQTAPDDRVTLRLDPAALRLFDPETGLALAT
ncbi:ABC transporter ATP-binding protein [Allorhizocola rhizosphaerae]|uniref:ABC transporter ATP-binding protein n=1 Tax=Allorhizocola rhizosphaerae TaxID=1872709 RepID=UPI000E3DFEDB|nr:ABC transporter ATP-binding protein [Allorhizocola rhizosphaerae]